VNDTDGTITYEVGVPQFNYDPNRPGSMLCDMENTAKYVAGQSLYDSGEWISPYSGSYAGTATVTASSPIAGSQSAVQGDWYSAFVFATNNVPTHDRISYRFTRADYVEGIYYAKNDPWYEMASVYVGSDGRMEIHSSAKGYPVVWGSTTNTVYEVTFIVDYSSTFGYYTNDAAGGWGAENRYFDGGTMYHPVRVIIKDVTTDTVLFDNGTFPSNQSHHFGVYNLTPEQVIETGGFATFGPGAKFDTIRIPHYTGAGKTPATLTAGATVGFDLVAGTRFHDFENVLSYAMLSANMMTGKSANAAQFAKYQLAGGTCGEWGYLPADISGPLGVQDCQVDLYDLTRLAAEWLKCAENLEGQCLENAVE